MEAPRDLKVVQGQTATLTCDVYGSPRPTVTWSRGSPPQPVVSGNRFTVHPGGGLEIKVILTVISHRSQQIVVEIVYHTSPQPSVALFSGSR